MANDGLFRRLMQREINEHFRKAALDALSTPEQLNQPLQLLRPAQWLLLTSLSLFSLIILTWSIFGRIPVRISGKGVLIKPNSLTVVQSETSGQITELAVNVGECLEKDSLMARVDLMSQEIEVKAVKTQLAQMRSQDNAQDVLAEQRLSQLQADIERVDHLAQMGAMSRTNSTADGVSSASCAMRWRPAVARAADQGTAKPHPVPTERIERTS